MMRKCIMVNVGGEAKKRKRTTIWGKLINFAAIGEDMQCASLA